MDLFTVLGLSLCVMVVQCVDVPRGTGLLHNFESSTGTADTIVRSGAPGIFTPSSFVSWGTAGSLPNANGQTFDEVEIQGNGFVYLRNNGDPPGLDFTPADIANPLDLLFEDPTNKLVAAAHLVRDQNHRFEYAYRGVDCSQSWNKGDCTKIAGETNLASGTNPYGPAAFQAQYLMVITHAVIEINPSTNNQVVYKVQVVVATLRARDASSFSSPKTYIFLGYEDSVTAFPQPIFSYIIFGSPTQNGRVFVNFNCPNSDSLILASRSNKECSKPGLYPFEVTVISGTQANTCVDQVVPKDSCTESVWCEGRTDQIPLQVEMYVNFKYPESPTITYYRYIANMDMEDDMCTRKPDLEGTISGVYVPGVSNVCSMTRSLNSGNDILTWAIIRVDEEGFRQHNDFVIYASCNIRDISTREATYTAGIVTRVDITKTHTTSFQIVASTGPAPHPFSAPCRLGEDIFFDLTFTPDNYEFIIDVYGLRPTTCQVSNNQQFQNGGNFNAFNADGSMKATTVIGTTVTFLNNGCPSLTSFDAFYLNNLMGEFALQVDKGFLQIESTSPKGGTWKLQAGPMKCASFKNTQKIYFRCNVETCSDRNQNPSEALCRKSCPDDNRRKKRQSANSTNETVLLETSILVEGHQQTEKAEENIQSPECLQSSVAIATIIGLVVALVLASGLSVAAFVKTMVNRTGSKTGMSRCSS